jgi:uncharacterized protein (DUF2141 family)|tara:strand:+ start:502 stop:2070 length:1569 start_codon:yes stop_codon:yes gene_type:complete
MGTLKYILPLLLFASCAQVGVPSGGAKDADPPVIVSISPALGATNISTEKGGSITVMFDEYIDVRQLSTQLLVSPPLSSPIKWFMKGKEVTFTWEEDLEENSTYVFQFGDAVVDIRESNPTIDFVHAFSTGNNFDTLSISGSVVDVFTGEKMADKRIFLFDTNCSADSISKGATPQFVGTTDKNGSFKLSYLPQGVYKIMAVDDIDRNYKWSAGESLALNENPVIINGTDSLPAPLMMQKTSNTEVKYFVSSSRDSLGLVEIQLSGVIEGDSKLETQGLEYVLEDEVMWVWADSKDIEKLQVILVGQDTLRIDEIEESELVEFIAVSGPEGRQISGTSASFRFNRPITGVIDSLITLVVSDSVMLENFTVGVNELNPFVLDIQASFGRGQMLELSFLPGSVEGFGEQQFDDTLNFKWSTFELKELGELSVLIDRDGWLELISSNGKMVEVKTLIKGEKRLLFKNLTPGSYALKWLGDDNGNGVWDGVSLGNWTKPESARILPEKVKVKADWSHELDWRIQKD